MSGATPRFTVEELWAIEDDARSCLLDMDGALHDPGHWLGLAIDLARSLRNEIERRLHG